MRSIKKIIRKLIEKTGREIVSFPGNDLERRIKLFRFFNINKIFDIGANEGQYALQMRKLGFKGEIISFEPLSDAYTKLLSASSKDNKWEAINFALGNRDYETLINISGNSVSSSILEMSPFLIESASECIYINKEKIIVKKLDTIFDNYFKTGR